MVAKQFAGLSHDLEVLGLITATFSLFSGEPDVLKILFGVSAVGEHDKMICSSEKSLLLT